MKKTADITKGPIASTLILFALPLLATSLIQQLYNTVDLIFVGQILTKVDSAAVGASSMLITCMVGLFVGVSVGVSVIASQFFGATNQEALQKVINTSVVISLWGGFFITVIILVFAPLFFQWMHTPEEIIPQAVGYIRIYSFSLIPMIFYNAGAGILRALGDSKSPMMYQLIGGFGNVIANTICIWILGWGVNGAAIATIFCQGLVAILVLRHLQKLDERYRLQWRKIKFTGYIAKSILKVGIPSGVQTSVITLSNLFVQFQINKLGIDAIAAFTAYFKVELFIYLPIMAFSQAVSVFTGQNIGAKREDRVKKGTKIAILVGICFTVVLSGLTLLFAEQAFGLFTTDETVMSMGVSIAQVTFIFYFLYVFLEIFASTIRGAGKALPPMIIVLINICAVRLVLLSILMSMYNNVQGVAIIYPITWLATSLCMWAYYRFGKWLPSSLSTK